MHSVKVFDYEVIDIFRGMVRRFRGVCSCGETTPGFAHEPHAINASFAHLDNVTVPS